MFLFFDFGGVDNDKLDKVGMDRKSFEEEPWSEGVSFFMFPVIEEGELMRSSLAYI